MPGLNPNTLQHPALNGLFSASRVAGHYFASLRSRPLPPGAAIMCLFQRVIAGSKGAGIRWNKGRQRNRPLGEVAQIRYSKRTLH